MWGGNNIECDPPLANLKLPAGSAIALQEA